MGFTDQVRRRAAGARARRPGPPAAAAEAVRTWLAALVAGRPAPPPDDADSLSLLRRSRLVALAAFADDGQAAFAADRRDAFASSVLMASAAAEAVGLLAAAGILSVTLKGPAFAVQILGDPARRSSCDADLLVKRADLPAVRRACAAAGMTAALHYPVWYEERWHDHAAYNGLPALPRVTIEIHWDIVRPGLSRLPVAEILAEKVAVACGSVMLPAPAIHWQTVLAAAHAAQHGFDARGLLDVALCGARLDAEGWCAAVEASRHARLGPALYNAVALSAAWLDWHPPAVVAGLRPNPLQQRLADEYLASLDPWRGISWGTLQLSKVATPVCVSSRLCGLPGIVFSLTDRPNVCTALDERLRRRRGAGAG